MLFLSLCILVFSFIINVGDAINNTTPSAVAYSKDDFSLQKRALNNDNILLFVAGLEGTGHHAIAAMFESCEGVSRCEAEKEISTTLFKYDKSLKIMHGLFGDADSNMASDQVNTIRERMKKLNATPGKHLFFLGLLRTLYAGMMSYPNYEGKNKPITHPDIHALAIIAESVGLDFRVLVLQRNASEILSSTGKRGFGGGPGSKNEPKILIDNAAALYTQLSLLDGKFYHCFRYSDAEHLTVEKKASLAQFLHPVNIPPVIDKMLSKIRPTNASSHRYLRSQPSPVKAISIEDNNEITAFFNGTKGYYTHLLQAQLNLIDELCKHHHRHFHK